ncbi:MAG: hypothetical protein WBV11_07460 [Salegentibacter sp.]
MRTLHQTRFFSSSQSDRARRIHIDFGHKSVRFSFCQLLAFREQIKNIDLATHFNGENEQGLEIISLCNREHLLVFNSLEILDLKDLLKGTFAALELQSLLLSET